MAAPQRPRRARQLSSVVRPRGLSPSLTPLMLVDAVETNAADACASRQKAPCGARCDVHVPRAHHGQRLLCEAGGVSLVDISAGISLDDIFVEFISWCDNEWGFFRFSRGVLRSHGLRRWLVEGSLTFSVSCHSHTSHCGVCAPLRLSMELCPFGDLFFRGWWELQHVLHFSPL